MKRRFIDRVFIERKILNLINQKYKETPLFGLTKETLLNWQTKTKIISQELVDLIYLLTELLRISSDCSRDIFEVQEIEPQQRIGELMDQLEVMLRDCNGN